MSARTTESEGATVVHIAVSEHRRVLHAVVERQTVTIDAVRPELGGAIFYFFDEVLLQVTPYPDTNGRFPPAITSTVGVMPSLGG